MLNELDVLDSLNGTEETELTDDKPRAHVDPRRGVFITSRGDEIELSNKRINSLMLERITNQGKPRIPKKEVTLLGKHKQLEANENDPGYLALLQEWKEEQSIKVMRYVFAVGVKGQPPQEFIDEQLVFFPEATDLDLKYLWVASLLPDEDVNAFNEAVLGYSLPTEQGLQESADSFPGED